MCVCEWSNVQHTIESISIRDKVKRRMRASEQKCHPLRIRTQERVFIDWMDTLMAVKLSVWITTSTWHAMVGWLNGWLADFNKQMDRSILLKYCICHVLDVSKCVTECAEAFGPIHLCRLWFFTFSIKLPTPLSNLITWTMNLDYEWVAVYVREWRILCEHRIYYISYWSQFSPNSMANFIFSLFAFPWKFLADFHVNKPFFLV